MKKHFKNILLLLTVVLLVMSLVACILPTPKPNPNNGNNGNNQNGGNNNQNGDNNDKDNNDKDENDKDENGKDAAERAALIAKLLKAVSEIRGGGDYFAALDDVLSHISPEIIENTLGQVIGGEMAEIISEYYANIIGATAYLDLFFSNINTIKTILAVVSEYSGEIPYLVTLATGVSKKQGEPVYYYSTYTFTIIADGEYRLEESELGLNFWVTELGETSYKIIDEAAETIYTVDYDEKKSFCLATNYQEEVLYSLESVLVGEDFAVQYYDSQNTRLVRMVLDLSLLIATISTQADYTEIPERISEGLPKDFLTEGDIFVLDTINLLSE